MEMILNEAGIETNTLPIVYVGKPQGIYSQYLTLQPFTDNGSDHFYFLIKLTLDVDDFVGGTGEISAIYRYTFKIQNGCVPYWKNMVDYFDGAIGSLLHLLATEAAPSLDLAKVPYTPLSAERLRSRLLEVIDEAY